VAFAPLGRMADDCVLHLPFATGDLVHFLDASRAIPPVLTGRLRWSALSKLLGERGIHLSPDICAAAAESLMASGVRIAHKKLDVRETIFIVPSCKECLACSS